MYRSPDSLIVLYLTLILHQLYDDALICERMNKNFLIIRNLPQLTREGREQKRTELLIIKSILINVVV